MTESFRRSYLTGKGSPLHSGLGFDEIQKEYTVLFRELLGDRFTEKTQAQVDFAARQVGYALQAFVHTFPHYSMSTLTGFIEDFISMQLKELVLLVSITTE